MIFRAVGIVSGKAAIATKAGENPDKLPPEKLNALVCQTAGPPSVKTAGKG